jgi:hypothetical protein
VASSPLDAHLNPRLRQQLHELRIDPDTVLAGVAPQPRSRRLRTWLAARGDGFVLAVGAAGCFAVLVVLVVLLTLPLTHTTPTPQTSPNSASTTVTLDDVTLQLSSPAYQRFTYGQGVLSLHLQVRNTSDAPTQLRAGALVLADSRGALFPVSWRDASGGSVDGFTDPRHVLVGLDPGAEVDLDVPFLTFGDGPFALRYQHQGEEQTAPLPALRLTQR